MQTLKKTFRCYELTPKVYYHKKIPLLIGGEEGVEHRTMSGFCVLYYITKYSSCKFSSVNGFSEIK